MYRFLIPFFVLSIFISCSKDEDGPPPPAAIPGIIDGFVTEFSLAPIDLTTPDKGGFYILSNNARYEVVFNAVANAASNAIITFATDTILYDLSREFTNLGNDAIAYNPVSPNLIRVIFTDGRKVTGYFDPNTSFGAVVGAAVISTWREPSDPTKPTQKAKDDIINLVHRYADKDGPGPESNPQYLFAEVFQN